MSDISDTLQPTIIYEPIAEQSKAGASEVSKLPVGLVAGTRHKPITVDGT